MFIYIKKAMVNLVSTYNNKRRKIKIKFDGNGSTLAWKLDLLISTFLTTFWTLENFIMQVYNIIIKNGKIVWKHGPSRPFFFPFLMTMVK